MLKRFLRTLIERKRKQTDQNIAEDLAAVLQGTKIGYWDIGAAEGLEPRWQPIRNQLAITALDPDPRAVDSLQKSEQSAHMTLHPVAAWDHDGSVQINLCRKPTVSSCFLPNRDFVDRFHDSGRFDIERMIDVPCRRLENLSGGAAHFLKIDVQGGALNVLHGAGSFLPSFLGLEVEVEFSPMYENQPLFGDVAAYLKQHGFEFIDFVSLVRWEREGFSGYGQAVFGDALFLRPLESFLHDPNVSDETVRVFIGICLLYGKLDQARRAIQTRPQTLDAAGLRAFEQFTLRDDRRRRHFSLLSRCHQLITTSKNRLHLLD